ncbi:MAG: hypothetical protein R3B07_25265 [Polyangiaceae bacterium]
MSDSTGFPSLDSTATHTPASTGSLAPNKHQLGDLITKLKPFQGSSNLETCLEIGKLVLDRFYDGSLDRFRELGTKHISFRKMSEIPELPVTGLFLYRSVCIYNVYHTHEAWRFRHNGMSHFRAVLNLPVSVQARLLDASEREQWTVNRLQHEASLKRCNSEASARAPMPAFVKALKAVRKHAAKEFHGYADLERAGELDRATAQELQRLASELSARFAEVAARLERR